MKINKFLVITVFRYFLRIIALAVILYVISQNIITKRVLTYNLDFSRSVSRDITGWYPEERVIFISDIDSLRLLAEPIYLKVYLPAKFDKLVIKGDIDFNNESIRLGLRYNDGSWLFKDITERDFSLDFSLDKAQVRRNKLELILAVSDLTSTSTVNLVNNWQLIFSR